MSRAMRKWNFLTNHALVLLCIARDPGIRVRDIAETVGITERAAHRILRDLEEEGYLNRVQEGRRNRYTLHPEMRLRHQMNRDYDIGALLEALGGFAPATLAGTTR